jgi:hypothetical protein
MLVDDHPDGHKVRQDGGSGKIISNISGIVAPFLELGAARKNDIAVIEACIEVWYWGRWKQVHVS